MVREIPQFNEKLGVQLGCPDSHLYILYRSQESDLYHQCHRESERHLQETQQATIRVPQRHSLAESSVLIYAAGHKKMDHAVAKLGKSLWRILYNVSGPNAAIVI